MTQVSARAALDLDALRERARRIRREIIISTTAAGSGHPTTSLSGVEILVALYFGGVLRYDAKRPQWLDRDRFILSEGHAAPLLYAVLAEAGYFSTELLPTLRKLGSPLEGHPNMRKVPGVEASTGSLGQGLSIGLGHALAGRLDGKDYRVFVMTGDGEIDEGQVWEATMAAAHFDLGSVTLIVNHNGYQQTDAVEKVMDTTPIAPKFAAFGWNSVDVDGHDLRAIHEALSERSGGQPRCIVARTVKGKGVSFIEGHRGAHGRALTPEEAERALREIG